MTWRRLCAILAGVLLVGSGAWALGRRAPAEDQAAALAALGPGVHYRLDAAGVPSAIRGLELPRQAADPARAALDALDRLGPAFRRRVHDGFTAGTVEHDRLGQEHVRVQQTYRGVPVVGGELVVHMDREAVVGVSGRFVPDLDLDVTPAISREDAAGYAQAWVAADGGEPREVMEIGEPAIFARHGDPALTIPVLVYYTYQRDPHLDILYVDAFTGEVRGVEPRLYTAKYRTIYDMNQSCIRTGSELPGTFLFDEGGSSSDSSAMGAYNGTGTTYDYYWQVFGRDSYDDNGSELRSSVHAQFSTGFFGCTKNNAAWIDTSNIHQMAYGDGDGSTLGDLAQSLDVTAHELSHGVTSRTANLAYEKESGALNEAFSDIMGRSASFWAGQGDPSVREDWTIGADVYTPGKPGDALRYMYDPAKDGQSADYYPDRNYASGCSPSGSNDYCGVHTNSGIANLEYYLLAHGGTHPRGKTSVNVPGIGIAKARAIWYRALTVYMTSSTNFEGARNATADAAADLYGGTCTAEWKAVQMSWDAVGVPGTWSCGGGGGGGGGGTYSISGNVGTAGATVTAGSASATSDAAGDYTISGLSAGTYTVTPSKSGCTFTPASRSVTVGPNATGVDFTASCGGGATQLLQNPGFEDGPVAWSASWGVIDNGASPPPHSGSWKAYLNGYGFYSWDYVYQDVDVPASASRVTLSFWLRVITRETTHTWAYDKLYVQLRRPDGTVLTTLAVYSNLDAGSSYVQHTFDITAYRGQTIRVYFYGIEDWSQATSFLVDDTALEVQ